MLEVFSEKKIIALTEERLEHITEAVENKLPFRKVGNLF